MKRNKKSFLPTYMILYITQVSSNDSNFCEVTLQYHLECVLHKLQLAGNQGLNESLFMKNVGSPCLKKHITDAFPL